MTCIRCNNKMSKYDYIPNDDAMVDYERCFMCNAVGKITYKQDRTTIDKVSWKSGNKYK